MAQAALWVNVVQLIVAVIALAVALRAGRPSLLARRQPPPKTYTGHLAAACVRRTGS